MPVKFDPFVLAIPDDWSHKFDDGKLRANKNDEIRLNVSVWDMTNVEDYSLDSVFETIKAGYFNSDVNWGAYSSITKNDDAIYQTLEYLDDPRMVIAVAEKTVKDKKMVLVISFAGNSGKEVEMYFPVFTNVLENIEII